MRGRAYSMRGLGGLLLLAPACNALTGVSELDTAPVAAAAAADAAPDAERGRDASADASTLPPPADAALDADRPCQVVSTPFKRGLTATSVGGSGGAFGAWTTPLKALVADGVSAVFVFSLPDMPSPRLEVRGFDLGVPPAARVTGVTVRVLRFGNLVQIVDDTVTLLGVAPIGDNRASPVGWPTALESREYGTVEDRWGVPLTPSMVNAVAFGVGLGVNYPMAVGGGPIAQVDEVTMSVAYCE